MPNDKLTPEQKRKIVEKEKRKHGSAASVRVADGPDANGQVGIAVDKFVEKEGVEPPPRRKP